MISKEKFIEYLERDSRYWRKSRPGNKIIMLWF